MLRRSSKKESNKKESADLTRRVTRDQVQRVFDPNVSPALTVSRGENVVVETQDCYRGLLKEEPDTHTHIARTDGIPVTGPIYIEDAHIGDVLSIQVKQIKTSDSGVFAVQQDSGLPGQDIHNPLVRVLDVGEKHVQLDDRLNLPLHPVIGNMGVAAKHGEMDSAYPGRHGGNMDTLEITTGSRVYLPVQVNGALLSLGDVKACVGDGQIAGSGVEVEAEVTLRVDTLPGGRFSWPRVESKGEWITITSASTVDQAARLAISEMVKWISQDKGLDWDTAYALVSLGGGLRVSQWGNPLITARMVFPKRLINKLKSVPTASGRLNYRSLPPASNGDSGSETVAADAEQPATRTSRRSGSGRSQRSSDKPKQSGSRRGTRQRSNGAASSARDESKSKQDEAAKGNGEAADSQASEESQASEVSTDSQASADNKASKASETSNANKASETSKTSEDSKESQDSQVASSGNARGTRTGRGRRRRTSTAKRSKSPEQADAPAVQPESAPAAGEQPEIVTAPAAGESREVSAEPAPATEEKPATAPDPSPAREAIEDAAGPADGPATAPDAGGRDDSNDENGSGAEVEVRKPTYGRRQRTVRRA